MPSALACPAEAASDRGRWGGRALARRAPEARGKKTPSRPAVQQVGAAKQPPGARSGAPTRPSPGEEPERRPLSPRSAWRRLLGRLSRCKLLPRPKPLSGFSWSRFPRGLLAPSLAGKSDAPLSCAREAPSDLPRKAQQGHDKARRAAREHLVRRKPQEADRGAPASALTSATRSPSGFGRASLSACHRGAP